MTRRLAHLALRAALLGIRLWLAMVWWRFGVAKLRGGWLDGWMAGHPLRHANPLRPIFQLIAAGQLPTPFGLYKPVAGLLLAIHGDALLTALIPITEVTLAIGFLGGFAPRWLAAAALFLNANLMLAAVGSVGVDGPVMLLELLLLVGTTLAVRVPARSSRSGARSASWRTTATVPPPANDRFRLPHLAPAGQHHPEPVVCGGLAGASRA
jgi:uncharacterized membrane protein YphA (DoxX/SURF4 family)